MHSPSAQGIFVACTQAGVFVRIAGRGACSNSVCLRDYGLRKLQEGHNRIYVDRRYCDGMDSTFLGVFAGLGLNLPERGKLVLLDISAGIRTALLELGLEQIPSLQTALSDSLLGLWPPDGSFELLPGSDPSVSNGAFGPLDRAMVMLESHEYLCQADNRNEEKFRDVTHLLREDIARQNANRARS